MPRHLDIRLRISHGAEGRPAQTAAKITQIVRRRGRHKRDIDLQITLVKRARSPAMTAQDHRMIKPARANRLAHRA